MKRKFKGGVYGFFERKARRNPSCMNDGHILGKLDTIRYIAMIQRSDNKYHHNFSNPTVLFKTGNAQWLMDRNECRLMDYFKSVMYGTETSSTIPTESAD